MSEHGKAKANRENSSITVNRYLLRVELGKGPLKSKFNLSQGAVALIKSRAIKSRFHLTTDFTSLSNPAHIFY